jgi:hypothetical protein
MLIRENADREACDLAAGALDDPAVEATGDHVASARADRGDRVGERRDGHDGPSEGARPAGIRRGSGIHVSLTNTL